MKEVLLYMHIILVKHADNLCFNCKLDFKNCRQILMKTMETF